MFLLVLCDLIETFCNMMMMKMMVVMMMVVVVMMVMMRNMNFNGSQFINKGH